MSQPDISAPWSRCWSCPRRPGAGKTTIARALLAGDPNLSMSVSVTTRAPRPGEVDGKDYYFVTVAEYDRMVQAERVPASTRACSIIFTARRAAMYAAACSVPAKTCCLISTGRERKR